MTQELKPTDHNQRRTFVNWILEQQQGLSKKIIFSDEAHFDLNGYVNKQNCRIWGEENPRIIQEQQFYPQRVTVWCSFWAEGVIGPYFFEGEDGKALTVNGNRYREMVTNFLWSRLERMDLQDIWFQQDGATAHTSRKTITLLQRKFSGCVISRNGDVNWPSR